MRVNVYAEEMTDRLEIIAKEIDGHNFTGLRFYLELPATVNGVQHQAPFMHRPGDDDSSAVTFWGKRDLREVLRQALALLDAHYVKRDGPAAAPAEAAQGEVDELIATVAARWAQSAKRYERVGSDWHMRMPGEWPVEVTLTVGQCRAAFRALAPKAAQDEQINDAGGAANAHPTEAGAVAPSALAAAPASPPASPSPAPDDEALIERLIAKADKRRTVGDVPPYVRARDDATYRLYMDAATRLATLLAERDHLAKMIRIIGKSHPEICNAARAAIGKGE